MNISEMLITEHYQNILLEKTVNRVIQHIQSHIPFASVSAERSSLSYSENISRMKEMEEILRKNPVRYNKQDGAWEGAKENSYMITPISEHSDPNTVAIFVKFIEALVRHFDQDAGLVFNGEKIIFIQKDGTEIDGGINSITFNQSKISAIGGYSIYAGTKYAFSDDDSEDNDTIFLDGHDGSRKKLNPDVNSFKDFMQKDDQ